jgi:hypothetical protein
MAKITVHKTVFWTVAEREMTGKVKQIFGDYALVKAADCDYVVKKSELSTRSTKIARGEQSA